MKHAWCILLALLLACEKTPEQPGSCQRPQENVCIEYDSTHAAAGKRLCAGLVWTAGASSCPTADLLGLCSKKDVEERMYSGAPNNYSAASARTACEHGSGTFRLP